MLSPPVWLLLPVLFGPASLSPASPPGAVPPGLHLTATNLQEKGAQVFATFSGSELIQIPATAPPVQAQEILVSSLIVDPLTIAPGSSVRLAAEIECRNLRSLIRSPKAIVGAWTGRMVDGYFQPGRQMLTAAVPCPPLHAAARHKVRLRDPWSAPSDLADPDAEYLLIGVGVCTDQNCPGPDFIVRLFPFARNASGQFVPMTKDIRGHSDDPDGDTDAVRAVAAQNTWGRLRNLYR